MYRGGIDENKKKHGKGEITWPGVAVGEGEWTYGELRGKGKITLQN